MEKTALGEIDLTVALSQDQETLPWPQTDAERQPFINKEFHDRATPLRLKIRFRRGRHGVLKMDGLTGVCCAAPKPSRRLPG